VQLYVFFRTVWEKLAMTVDTLFASRKSKTIRFKQIKAVYEIITVNDEISSYLKPLTRYVSPQQIYETFSFLKRETKEYFFALHLDGKNRIVCVDQVSVGSLNQSIVHPREVFKSCLLSNAAAVILVHQHPTGDSAPSSEDIAITRRLKEAGDLLGIKVLDHIIIGDDTYLSFVEKSLL